MPIRVIKGASSKLYIIPISDNGSEITWTNQQYYYQVIAKNSVGQSDPASTDIVSPNIVLTPLFENPAFLAILGILGVVVAIVGIFVAMKKKWEKERKERKFESVPETVRVILSDYFRHK